MNRIRMGRLDLFLTVHGHAGEAHFAGQFIRAFLRLPDPVLAAMQSHWQRGGPDKPVVELVTAEQLAAAYPERKRRRSLAVVSDAGYLLQFDAAVFTRAPDFVVQDVVGHELAHVVQHLLGLSFATDRECELDADQRAEAWGFSVFSVNRWLAGAGRLIGPRTREEISLHHRPGGRYEIAPRVVPWGGW